MAGRAPIVFLQGFAAPADVWAPIVGRLTATHECITVDWPFGAHHQPLHPDAEVSPPTLADAVVEVLDHLDVDKAILVGNDSGGVIAQLVIAAHPDRVAAAALVACDAFECFPPPVYRPLFRLARVPGVVRLMAEILSVRWTARSRLGYGSVVSAADRCHEWGRALRTTRGVRRDIASLMFNSSRTQTLAAARTFSTFDRPVLVVWAENDQLFPAELGQRLTDAFPNAQLRVATNSRTFVPVDQPEQLTGFLAELLERVA